MISPENHAKNPCSEGHTIDMVIPTVDPYKLEIQHPEWVGKVCDCRKLIFVEEKCYCQNANTWEIHWQPNPNY